MRVGTQHSKGRRPPVAIDPVGKEENCLRRFRGAPRCLQDISISFSAIVVAVGGGGKKMVRKNYCKRLRQLPDPRLERQNINLNGFKSEMREHSTDTRIIK